MRAGVIAAACSLAFLACKTQDRPVQQRSGTVAATAPVDSFLVTAQAIGLLHLCVPLDSVTYYFPGALDTTIVGEDNETTWPAKHAAIASGGTILFESSWVDHSHLWSVAIRSGDYHTRHGASPGLTIGEVRARGLTTRLTFGEGVPIVELGEDSVWAEIDSVSLRPGVVPGAGASETNYFVPDVARVVTPQAGGDCRQPTAT